MKNNLIFVIGVARSGSTLLARIINAHSSVSAFIDSCETIYKAVRTKVASAMDSDVALESPFCDPYFSPDRRKLSEGIQNCDLKKIDISAYQKAILQEMSESSAQYSPAHVDASSLDGSKTGYDYLKGLQDYFRKENNTGLVYKDNYIIEFIWPLKRAFPDAKFLFPVRDPRALVASRMGGAEKFGAKSMHLMSALRSWRKHLAFSFAAEKSFPGDVLVVPYESLTLAPGEWIARMCSFLDLPYEETMLGKAGFGPGKTSAWQNNSSFSGNSPGIFTDSVERWRHTLSEDILKAVEYLCCHEMDLFHYKREFVTSLPVSDTEAGTYLQHDVKEKEFSWRCDQYPYDEEIRLEQNRHRLILGKNMNREEILFNLLTLETAEKLQVTTMETPHVQ